MRWFLAVIASVSMSACGAQATHPYPEKARASFTRTCTAGDAVCECIWGKITRAMPFEEYEAALDRYDQEGLMDPRISAARTECLERHAG